MGRTQSRRNLMEKGAILIVLGAILIGVNPFTNTLKAYAGSPQAAGGGQAEAFQQASPALIDAGTYPKWSKVEIVLTGPPSQGMSPSVNPFKIEVNVIFTGPGGRKFLVPAFYDGDGNGGMDGDVWKARFSPDAVGRWSYISQSSESILNGKQGSFTVTEPSGCEAYAPGGLPNLGCVGRLQYAGVRYLKFADGPYWVKGGADDPEDFLAPGVTAGFDDKYAAIDFLASKGVNSLYMLLHNVDGDDNNVWPWVGSSSSEAKTNSERFDVGKLAEWENIFSYLQSKGITLHLVLEEDDAWTGFNRSMYYREMIARFGHHNSLIWNISEEYQDNYSSGQIKEFAALLHSLDPYDHPVTVHNAYEPDNWEPFLGDERFDLTSLQTPDPASPQNETAVEWLGKVEASGRTIPVSFDETGKINASSQGLARNIVWSVYLGGANFEMHTWDLSRFQDFAGHYGDMTRARALLESLPFTDMQPMNELLVDGNGYVLAKPGSVYVIYLPNGGKAKIDLSQTDQDLKATWYNPRSGESTSAGTMRSREISSVNAPSSQDWVLLLNQSCAALPSANISTNGIEVVPLELQPISAHQLFFPLLVNNC